MVRFPKKGCIQHSHLHHAPQKTIAYMPTEDLSFPSNILLACIAILGDDLIASEARCHRLLNMGWTQAHRPRPDSLKATTRDGDHAGCARPLFHNAGEPSAQEGLHGHEAGDANGGVGFDARPERDADVVKSDVIGVVDELK